MSKALNVRTLILATAVTATTVTGVWLGADLKIEQEFKQEVKARAEATPADKITFLEQARPGLISKKIALERKISQLEAKAAEEENPGLRDGSEASKGNLFAQGNWRNRANDLEK